jgi:hypothetical protein
MLPFKKKYANFMTVYKKNTLDICIIKYLLADY